MIIQSAKKYDGFSTVFRQWKAEGTHCKFLHGYAVSFKVWFEGKMDEKNWVMDFGRAKRSTTLVEGENLKQFLDGLLDHTTIIAENDPELQTFIELEKRGAIKLKILPEVGAERFGIYLFDVLNRWSIKDTSGRVIVRRIEVFENDKNSAVIEGEDQDYEKFFKEIESK